MKVFKIRTPSLHRYDYDTHYTDFAPPIAKMKVGTLISVVDMTEDEYIKLGASEATADYLKWLRK